MKRYKNILLFIVALMIPLCLSCFVRDNPLDQGRQDYTELNLYQPSNNVVYQSESIHVSWEFSGTFRKAGSGSRKKCLPGTPGKYSPPT